MSRFYTPSITDEELEQGMLYGEKVWSGNPEETPGVEPVSGNAWNSQLEEAGSQVWSNPQYRSLLESTRSEGDTPVTISSIPLNNEALNSSNVYTETDDDQSVIDSISFSNEIIHSSTDTTNNQDFSKQSAWSQTKDAAGNIDWGARAGIIADVAGHAAKLVSILDGSWAESQKKIIGHGKYHGPGRAWWA